MNRIIVIIILPFFLLSCKTKKNKTSIPFELIMTKIVIKGSYQEENILMSKKIQYDFLKDINKDIKLIEGQIFLKEYKTPFIIEYANRQNVYDPYQKTDIMIKNKYFQQRNKYKNIENLIDSVKNVVSEKEFSKIIPSLEETLIIKEFFLDEELNIDGGFRVYSYTVIFKKGCGYWKDFYNEGHLKEEGEVKNNYKVGEWKYYNKNGEIDSLKVYSVKDSVDVRFPHCLFNKNEPCY